MMDNENQNQPNQKISFESLDILIGKWRDGTFSEIIDDWKWIFSYSKRYKGAIAFYTILGIFSTSMGLVGSVASKYMIDIITGYQMSKLWIMVLITLGSAFFSLTIGNVIGRISTKLSIYINNDIQADIFDKIIDADWMEINQYSNGDVLNRFNSDVNTISGNAISWLPTIIIAVYDFVATFAVIWHYDKIMSLLAFASAPFMLLMSKFLISKQREYGKKVREMSSEMMTFEVETFYNFDTIKSFGISSLYGKKMRNWQEKFKDISLKYNMFTIKTNIVMSIIGMVVQYAAFGYCLFRLWTRDISYGTMTLFLQQRSNLNGAFNNLVSIIPNFLNSSISAHRIRELAQLKKEVHIPESSEMDAYVEDGFEVKMRDVDFSYIEGNRVITDSGFMANPGEIVALVGPSGEGKTTMIADSSTTVMEALKLLPQSPDITVVTNSTEVFREFQQSPLNIISTGGEYNIKSLSLQGQLAKTNILKYNVSLALISCKGLSIEKGVLDSNESEAEVKKAMLSQAEEVALLVDFSKFDQSAFVNLIDLQKVNYIITDRSPSEKWIEYCSEQGIELIY